MEKNTKGTTIVNIIFKNKSPRGWTTMASSPQIKPAILPMIIATSIITGNRYAFQEPMLSLPFLLTLR
jgi:hypothetical protein